jgi:hypothetical protein
MDKDTYDTLLQQLSALEAKFAHVSGRSGPTVQTPPGRHHVPISRPSRGCWRPNAPRSGASLP